MAKLYTSLWKLQRMGIEHHDFVIYQPLTSCPDASAFHFLLGSSYYPFNFLFILQHPPTPPTNS
jgi:hypothetical protein